MTKIDEILAQEMTRKEFLIAFGLAALSVLGFSSIIGLFTKASDSPHLGGSYSSGAFGR